MKKRPQVALVLGATFSYERDIIRGILRYSQSHGNWDMLIHHGMPVVDQEQLETWQGDGVIANVRTPALQEKLLARNIPVVNVSRSMANLKIPSVIVDYAEAGRMAARHFLDRGFTQFSYLGEDKRAYSDDCFAGYREVIEAEGYKTSFKSTMHRWRVEESEPDLKPWLRSLKQPVAILSVADNFARQAIQTCSKLGILVPDQAAFIGTSNDQIICELATPHLSSVDLAADRVGYQAAALLERMMKTGKQEGLVSHIPPNEIVTRQSSDVLAVEDPKIVEAVRFIRENSDKPIGVTDVSDQVQMSSRTLERRFREILGRSPAAEIRRVHFEKAKRLLVKTELPLARIAELSGFSSNRYLNTIFQKHFDMTPAEFRRQNRDT